MIRVKTPRATVEAETWTGILEKMAEVWDRCPVGEYRARLRHRWLVVMGGEPMEAKTDEEIVRALAERGQVEILEEGAK